MDLLFQDSAGFLRSQVKEHSIRAVLLLHIFQQNAEALSILKVPWQHPHGVSEFSSSGMRPDWAPTSTAVDT